jgi:hypothetical protein
MRTRTLAAFLAAASLATLAGPAGANSDVAAAVAAGVVGAAIGASLADHHHHHKHGHKAHFSPSPGIECYDYQRACYHADGGFAKNWTWRVYG